MSNQEEEYFAKLDREKRLALRKKLMEEKRLQNAEELRALHYLKCGKCGHGMYPQNFKGVEVDVCENCGAVLLDPGELEELAGEETGAFRDLVEFFGMNKKQ